MILVDELSQTRVRAPLARFFDQKNQPEIQVAPEQAIPQTAQEEFEYWLGGSWIVPIPLDSFAKFQSKSRERASAENKVFIGLTQHLVEELIDVLVSFETSQTDGCSKLHLETAAGQVYVFLGGNTAREMFGERTHNIHEKVVETFKGKILTPLSPATTERLKNYQPNCDIRMLVPTASQEKLGEVIKIKFAQDLADFKFVSLRPGFSMVVATYSYRTGNKLTKTPVYFIMLDPNTNLENDWRIGAKFSDDQRRFFPYGLNKNQQKTAFQSHKLMHSERILALMPAKIDKPSYKSPLQLLNAVTRMILPRAYRAQDDETLFRVFDNQTVANLRRELSRLVAEKVWEDDSWHAPEVEAQLAVCAYYAPKLTLKLLISIGWLSGAPGSALDTSLPDYDWQDNAVAETAIVEFEKIKNQTADFTVDQNWQTIKNLLQNLQISPITQRAEDKFLL